MQTISCRGAIALLVLGLFSPAVAATVSVVAYGPPGCDIAEFGTNETIIQNCASVTSTVQSSLSGTASIGSLGAAAVIHANGTESPANANVISRVTFTDQIFLDGALNATLRISYGVTGFQSLNLAQSGASFTGYGLVSGGWDISAIGGAAYSNVVSQKAIFNPTSGDVETEFTTVATELSGKGALDFDFIGGQISLTAGLEASASCFAFVGTCSARSEYGGTLNFLGGVLLDASGNAIDGASLRSTSGFDYLSGVALAAVPTPGSMAMLVSAGLLLFSLRGRRSKRGFDGHTQSN